MTVTQTPRFGFDVWSNSSTDLWPGRPGWNATLDKIEQAGCILLSGLLSARPAAGVARRFYWATDNSRLYLDSGATWTEVSPTTGGGIPAQNTVGGVGQEGISRIAARSDHRHPHLGEWMQCTNTAAGGVPDSAWTRTGLWTTAGTVQRGTDLIFDPNGPIGALPGLYRIDGYAQFQLNGSSYRVVGISTSINSPPLPENQVDAPVVGHTANRHINTNIVTSTPNTQFVLWVLQDSGVTLQVGPSKLTIEYRG